VPVDEHVILQWNLNQTEQRECSTLLFARALNLNIHIRSYKELQEQLGHPNDAVFKATEKKFNLKYDTTPMLCENVLVLRLRPKTFQKKLHRFWLKRKEIELQLI
jgi:hypothetical protein